jgi:hypothetical protein
MINISKKTLHSSFLASATMHNKEYAALGLSNNGIQIANTF